MVGINKKAVALIVIAFFFLILEKQVEMSRLRLILNANTTTPQESEAKMDDFTATYAAKYQASETCLVLAKEPILVRKPTKRVFCRRLVEGELLNYKTIL